MDRTVGSGVGVGLGVDLSVGLAVGRAVTGLEVAERARSNCSTSDLVVPRGRAGRDVLTTGCGSLSSSAFFSRGTAGTCSQVNQIMNDDFFLFLK